MAPKCQYRTSVQYTEIWDIFTVLLFLLTSLKSVKYVFMNQIKNHNKINWKQF